MFKLNLRRMHNKLNAISVCTDNIQALHWVLEEKSAELPPTA